MNIRSKDVYSYLHMKWLIMTLTGTSDFGVIAEPWTEIIHIHRADIVLGVIIGGSWKLGNSLYLGERFHGERPLCDQLLPAGQGGEDGEEVIPQFPADVDIQVSLNPGHYQRLCEVIW